MGNLHIHLDRILLETVYDWSKEAQLEFQQEAEFGGEHIRLCMGIPENAMGDIPKTSKDDVMTYTVDPRETVASDMWEKLFAQVTDQISATEKRMTESFTQQFDILLEEVRSQ
ncbi:hypothetical protein Q3G72_010553 [Acer saccharum]|nr:hypothetical protein Q3G72_010553 [Acer saccharum]